MSTTATNLPLKPLQVSVEVNWSDLPAELLQTISKMLHDICDFTYFRSVCKSWYMSTSISDHSPQIPWLLSRNNGGRLCFYSIISDKIRTIHCPRFRHRGICGPSRGYLYTFQHIPRNRWKHFLLNPVTKDEVPLQLRESLHERQLMCMSWNLIGDDDYIAFLDHDLLWMEYYQPHRPERNYAVGRSCPLRDIQITVGHAIVKGMHFVHLKTTCETEVFDIARGYLFVIPPPEMLDDNDKVAFVESDGKILRIIKHRKNCHLEPTALSNYDFHIYQLVAEDEIRHQYRWVKIRGIGNNVLFLNYFWLVSGMSVKATESIGLRGNCIYYIEHLIDSFGRDCGIYRYDIEEGRSQRIPCPCKHFWTWFVPSFVRLLPSN